MMVLLIKVIKKSGKEGQSYVEINMWIDGLEKSFWQDLWHYFSVHIHNQTVRAV